MPSSTIAGSADRIRFSDACLQSRRDLSEQDVADDMSERIVGLFEVIDVEAENRKFLAALEAGDRLFHSLLEKNAVCQSGQRIVARHVR